MRALDLLKEWIVIDLGKRVADRYLLSEYRGRDFPIGIRQALNDLLDGGEPLEDLCVC